MGMVDGALLSGIMSLAFLWNAFSHDWIVLVL